MSRLAQAASSRSASSLIGSGNSENCAPVRCRSRKPRGVRSALQAAATTRARCRQWPRAECRTSSRAFTCRRARPRDRDTTRVALHARVQAVVRHDRLRPITSGPPGRSTRRASAMSRRQSAPPPMTWISITASNVASRNGRRSPSACTSRGAARAAPARPELAQHAERQVDADIVVARRHERPADPPGAGAEIEEAGLRRRSIAASTAARIASTAPSGMARWRSKLGAAAS